MKIDRTEPLVIAYNENKYSAFPDIVLFKEQYICVYRESDSHHPSESSIILLKSKDGLDWEREVFCNANIYEHGYVFNCPRLSVVGDRIALTCDTKSSRNEKTSDWNILIWWSDDGKEWSSQLSTGIEGMVPDKILKCNKKLLMGYHIQEGSTLVQMVASSFDKGLTWRDRTTIASNEKNDFCEGSIVLIDGKNMLCYLRDNRGKYLRSQSSFSVDGGLSWSLPSKLDFCGHRIVANIKKNEPYKNILIATFRNTTKKSISMMLLNMKNKKIQISDLEFETKNSLFDFGYSGWAEKDNGEIIVVYYIQRHHKQPMICLTTVRFR